MFDAQGIGLAASQVNVQDRAIVMDSPEQRNEPKAHINPEIRVIEPVTIPYEEGCRSVPGL